MSRMKPLQWEIAWSYYIINFIHRFMWEIPYMKSDQLGCLSNSRGDITNFVLPSFISAIYKRLITIWQWIAELSIYPLFRKKNGSCIFILINDRFFHWLFTEVWLNLLTMIKVFWLISCIQVKTLFSLKNWKISYAASEFVSNEIASLVFMASWDISKAIL